MPKVASSGLGISSGLLPCDDQPSASAAQTPVGNQSSTILISNSSELTRVPMSAALFCGSALTSIIELDNYLQCGVPVLIIQAIFFIIKLIKKIILLNF